MKAFLAALLLFIATVGGCHLYITSEKDTDIRLAALGTLPSEKKGKLREALMDGMREDGFPVFGSSEFQHGAGTPYHPAQVFAESDFHPMLIGAGYYQCLSHAITLASIEESMKVRKAALILSPQWFRKTGVVDQAYASRFSETHYAGTMANNSLSDDTKEYISERTQKLLQVDQKTQERVLMYDDVLWKKTGGGLEIAREKVWLSFLQEKELFETMLLEKSKKLRDDEESENPSAGEPDWTGLLKLAGEEGEKQNRNEFYINEDAYQRLKPRLPQKKDMNRDAVKGYQGGPEYADLECFLTVCQELGIQPMIVIVPVNGYYYDFTGFPREARQKYYAKVRTVAEKYGAEIADFSDQEFTKYFFEDSVHLGKKGWVMVNESLYRFYKEA